MVSPWLAIELNKDIRINIYKIETVIMDLFTITFYLHVVLLTQNPRRILIAKHAN